MRHDAKLEFDKIQENMEDMCLKLLAEIKKSKTANNSMPNEEILQS